MQNNVQILGNNSKWINMAAQMQDDRTSVLKQRNINSRIITVLVQDFRFDL